MKNKEHNNNPATDETSRRFQPSRDDHDNRSHANLLVALIIVVIVGLGLWLAHALKANLDLQRCLAERRSDCMLTDTFEQQQLS